MRNRYSYGMVKVARLTCLALTCSTALTLLLAETIGKVSVVTKVSDVDLQSIEQIVLGSIESVPGEAFEPAALVEDIRRLHQTGCFEVGITYQKKDMEDGQAEIVWFLTPKRRIRAIQFEGNDSIKTKRLESEVGQSVGDPIDRAQLARDRNAVLDRYRSAGYYGTKVAADTVDADDAHELTIVFRIEEAARVKLKGVQFTGNTVFTEADLRRTVLTRRPWWRYIFRWGNYFNEPQLEADKDLLRDAYADKGYLDFSVEKVETQYNKKDKWVTLVFHLQEGSPYTVSGVSIDGNSRFSAPELMELVGTAPRERFSSSRERADVHAVEGKYERLGYIDIRCYPVHTINSEQHTVNVEYRIREGQVAHIRDIYIVGNEITQDRVIRRELAIQPGDLGDYGKIRASKARLENLNYFDTVEITPVATEMEDLRDLRIELTEKRTGQFSLGAGFSSEDDVVGFIEVAENNFDLNRLFDWPPKGAGQRLRLRAQLGTERTDVIVSFTEPWFLQRKLRLDVEAFSRTRVEDEYDQEMIGMGTMLTKPLGKYWRQSFGLRAEHVRITDMESGVSDELLEEEDSYWANRFVLRLTRDSRDRYMFATRGSRLSLGAEIVTQALGSYSNYGRFNVEGTKYIPVFSDYILKVGAEVAVASKFSGDPIAIFDRYFAGGAYSIRGFERREVSPVDENEDPVGGKSMLLANVELIKPVRDFLLVSVFCDTGNVWAGAWDIDPTDINASVGIGLQFKMLPVRIEYGYPIMTEYDHLDDSNGELHFNIGYSF